MNNCSELSIYIWFPVSNPLILYSSCTGRNKEFTINSGYRLLNNVLCSFYVQRLSGCITGCMEDSDCLSVNFIRSSNGYDGGGECEINYVGTTTRAEDYVKMAESIHAMLIP